MLASLGRGPSTVALEHPVGVIRHLHDVRTSRSSTITERVATFSRRLGIALSDCSSLSTCLPLGRRGLFRELQSNLILNRLLRRCFPNSVHLRNLVHNLSLARVGRIRAGTVFRIGTGLGLVIGTTGALPGLIVIGLKTRSVLRYGHSLILNLL